ncbi:hypothetical protein L2E82_31168 [Cichorium intybus]|uniref:Uncharacterized protein n=1 Tax=Cichorium intybus TaxID=13427 RepID=A0ACB9D338_CICIN|nr:hypothetical protein L2E82_31168 [Cichorium intybus]
MIFLLPPPPPGPDGTDHLYIPPPSTTPQPPPSTAPQPPPSTAPPTNTPSAQPPSSSSSDDDAKKGENFSGNPSGTQDPLTEGDVIRDVDMAHVEEEEAHVEGEQAENPLTQEGPYVLQITAPAEGEQESNENSENEEKANSKGEPEVAFSSDIDDEEGLFDMPYHAAPITVLYPGQPFPVESSSTAAPGGSSIPSADHLSSDVSDDDIPLVFKRKRKTESSSVLETSKRQKTSSQVLKLANEWCMSPSQVEEIATEHNLVMTNRIICSKDAKVAKQVVQEEGGISRQKDLLSHFDSMTMEQRRITSRAESANRKIDLARFKDVFSRRCSMLPIVKVGYSKNKGELILKLHLQRKDKEELVPEQVFIHEVGSFGFTEWEEMLFATRRHKGLYVEELHGALKIWMDKVYNLNLIPASDRSVKPSTSGPKKRRRKSKEVHHLALYGTKDFNNIPPPGAPTEAYTLVRTPFHGMTYEDENGKMCFMRNADLKKASTEHIFHLRLECFKAQQAEGFHMLISHELGRREPQLHAPEYSWIKPEILSETEYVASLGQSSLS